MTRAQWRLLDVINSHDLVRLYAAETGLPGVYFGYSSNDGSRMNMGVLQGWYVYRPGYKTDPQGPWINHGNKAFSTWGMSMASALQEADEWASNRYGTTRGPVAISGFGRDRFPPEVAAWAKRKLKGA